MKIQRSSDVPRWMTRGLCRGADPSIFDGDSLDDETAKAYCFRCPVRVSCLTYSLEHSAEIVGVWGGLNDDERTAHKRGGPRRTCPGCRGLRTFTDGRDGICLLCGLTWKIY